MTIFQYLDRAVLSLLLAYLLANSIVLPGATQTPPSKNNCRRDNSEEVATIKTTDRRVSRQQGQLTIKTPQKSVVFRDACKTDDSTTFTLAAYYRDLDYFLVNESSYEFGQYFLINGKTGAKTQLWAKPLFSPDRQRFASMVIDELNGNTSVYIYRIAPTGVKLEYRNTDKWRPTNPIWRDSKAIEFIHNPMSGKPVRVLLEYKKDLKWRASQK